MRQAPDISGKLRAQLRFALLAIACILVQPASMQAEGLIKDPKAMGDKIAATIQDGDIVQIKSILNIASRNRMTEEDLAPAVDPFASVFAKCETPGVPDLLASKMYGNSIAKFWYRVLFNEKKKKDSYKVVYVRLSFTNVIKTWQLTNFNMTTDIDDIELP